MAAKRTSEDIDFSQVACGDRHFKRARLKSERYFSPLKDSRAIEEGNDAGFDWRRVTVGDQRCRDDSIASVVKRNCKC
jgi:hypothetical protein